MHKLSLQVSGNRTGNAAGNEEQDTVDEDSFVKVPRSTGSKTEPQPIKGTARGATEIYFSKSVGETVGETCREELGKPSSLDFNDSHFEAKRNIGLKVNTKKGKRKKSLGGSFEKIEKADVEGGVAVDSPVDKFGFSFFPVRAKTEDSKKGSKNKVIAKTALPSKEAEIVSVESTSQTKTPPLPKKSEIKSVIAKSPAKSRKSKAESKISVETISQNKTSPPKSEQKISNFEQTNKIDDLPPSSIILHYQKKEVKESLAIKTYVATPGANGNTKNEIKSKRNEHSTSQNGNTVPVKELSDNKNRDSATENGKANAVTETHISKPQQIADSKLGETIEQETKSTVADDISDLNETTDTVTENGIKNTINTIEQLNSTITDTTAVTVNFELKDTTENLISSELANEIIVAASETFERDSRSLENTSEQSVTDNSTNNENQQQLETNTTRNVDNDESEINTASVKMVTNTEIRVLTLNANEHQDTVLYRLEQNWVIQFRLGPSLLGRKVVLFSNYPQLKQEFQRKHYYELQWLQDEGCSHSDDTALYAELVVRIPGSFHYYFTYLNE